jgi:cobalt-zinc-cadmium efflux system membrane fusion protein
MKRTVQLTGIFMLFFLVFACQNRKDSLAQSQVAESETINGNTVISLSKEQFELGGMELGTITAFTYEETVNANGYIDVPPQNRAKIGTFLGGYVKTANLLPGDKVKKGQAIVTLENIDYLKLQQNFLEAKEKLAYLKSVYEVQVTLAEEKISSQRSHLQARSEYLSMLANYESLKKQLKLLHLSPENISAETLESSITLPAPFDGYITQMNVVPGMFVNPSDIICEIINPDHMHLELKVFEKDVLNLKQGQVIEFRIPGASSISYMAEIILIGKTVEGDDRTISVHAHINNDKLVSLTTGMYVEARIKTNERMLSGLPVDALVSEEGGTYIMRKTTGPDDNLSFEKIPVEVGLKTEQWFEVLNPDSFTAGNKEILVKGGFNLAGM